MLKTLLPRESGSDINICHILTDEDCNAPILPSPNTRTVNNAMISSTRVSSKNFQLCVCGGGGG